ncbi:MAG: hypothetical protein H0U95_05275 [Bacteroidetes bacterium]|nr:hypothetical protein [Bacteroidota bacterium]
MSFTCYLILVAFISVISIDISSRSYLSLKKTQVASNQCNLTSDLNLVFEEERDTTDPLFFTVLSQHVFSLQTVVPKVSEQLGAFNTNVKNKINNLFKVPLFIYYRAIKI